MASNSVYAPLKLPIASINVQTTPSANSTSSTISTATKTVLPTYQLILRISRLRQGAALVPPKTQSLGIHQQQRQGEKQRVHNPQPRHHGPVARLNRRSEERRVGKES